MEESLSLLTQIKKEFNLGEVDLRTYSPLTLAFVGDCIYDLIIRTVVVERHNASPNRLHKEKSHLVKAQTQAEMGTVLQQYLTEEELAVYRRGRNAKSYTTAKNASVGDYWKATALEALYGYLYLDGRMERLMELVKISLRELDLAL
ncbi:Mini-ribonuclease 3 [Eisenbergiella porci]|uniref:Mini-ribonuclease 3 n=1 Tax=Eisenbergiella porci TaxID=2652274 RepID=UPI002A7EC055|nr:ribonuclease III domain-containing protein [Eisenbergiella porci]